MGLFKEKCEKCNKEIDSALDECPYCFEKTKTYKLKLKQYERTGIKFSEKSAIGVVLFMLLLGALVFFGNFHIVSSSEMGTKIIPKVVFTLKETFINLDEITGMPIIAAKSKYPLSVKALQKEMIIESDEEIQRRVQEEIEEKYQDIQQKAVDEYNKTMKQLNQQYQQ